MTATSTQSYVAKGVWAPRRTGPSGAWDDPSVLRLRALFNDGLSCSQAATALMAEFGRSFSRNSVIGKLTRLGLYRASASAPARVPKPVKPPRAPKPCKIASTVPTAQRKRVVDAALRSGAPVPPWSVPKTVPVEIALAPRNWITRRPLECAYPVDGDGEAVRSCCNPTAGPTYCAEHHQITHRPAVSWERDEALARTVRAA